MVKFQVIDHEFIICDDDRITHHLIFQNNFIIKVNDDTMRTIVSRLIDQLYRERIIKFIVNRVDDQVVSFFVHVNDMKRLSTHVAAFKAVKPSRRDIMWMHHFVEDPEEMNEPSKFEQMTCTKTITMPWKRVTETKYHAIGEEWLEVNFNGGLIIRSSFDQYGENGPRAAINDFIQTIQRYHGYPIIFSRMLVHHLDATIWSSVIPISPAVMVHIIIQPFVMRILMD